MLSAAPRWHAITHTPRARWTLMSFVLPAYFKPHFFWGFFFFRPLPLYLSNGRVLGARRHPHECVCRCPCASGLPRDVFIKKKITKKKNDLPDCLISCYFINLPLFPSRGGLLKNNPFDLRTLQLGLNNRNKTVPQLENNPRSGGILSLDLRRLDIERFRSVDRTENHRRRSHQNKEWGGRRRQGALSGSRSCRNQSTQATSRAEKSEIVN